LNNYYCFIFIMGFHPMPLLVYYGVSPHAPPNFFVKKFGSKNFNNWGLFLFLVCASWVISVFLGTMINSFFVGANCVRPL